MGKCSSEHPPVKGGKCQNVSGHGSEKLVQALLCGGDTKLEMATYCFLASGWDLQEEQTKL